MTADVISLPEPLTKLADRIRAAYERTERGRQEWIEGTLELAQALADGRKRFPADRAFGAWLAENELDRLGKDDRAALITMNAEPPLLRDILMEQTEQILPDTIWRKSRDRFRKLPKADNPAPIAHNAPPEPIIPDSVSPNETTTTEPAPALKHNSPFYGLERGEEVAAIFANKDARVTIGKIVRNRKSEPAREIWRLILIAIDAGFLTATNTGFSKPTAQILFPNGPRQYCTKFDLTNPKQRKIIADRVMPAALARRDAVIAAPLELEKITESYWRDIQTAQRETAARNMLNDAVRALPDNQQTVVMFGQTLWPRVDHRFGEYDYDQLRAAIWYFRDLDSWLEGRTHDNAPRSRAILIRLSTRWPLEYLDRATSTDDQSKLKQFYRVVDVLSRLLENNPQAECKIPMSPKIEGQW